MKIKSNIIIFSTDNEERKDVRRLKQKRLQLVLDEKNNLPIFEVNNKEYIKTTVCQKVEEMFGTSKFYIEQLYTWGDPKYYTKEEELIVSYLVIINKNNIKKKDKQIDFYTINIENEEGTRKLQKVMLESENKTIEYEIETTMKRQRENIDYIHTLTKPAKISELTAIIIHTGIKRLRNRIENTNIAFSFLEKEFTLSELQQVYEIILDKKLVAANFRKKVEPMIKKTDKVVKDAAYRPSMKYTFNEEYKEYWV